MMQARSAAYLAAAAVLALSAPAFAGEGHPLPPPPQAGWHGPMGAPGPESAPVWQQAPQHGELREGQLREGWEAIPQPELPEGAVAEHVMPHQPMGHPGMPHGAGGPGMMHHGAMQSVGQRLGYSPEQRRAWLETCVANQLPPERRNGGLIGGLLGAVAGGVAGNRIADGSRLAGTLIGGGVGAVAGAVLGTVIDRDGDDDRLERAVSYCETYLGNYEAQSMQQSGYGYGYPAAGYAMAYPVMMVAVPTMGHQRMEREEVVEEWVEVSEPTYVSRPAPRPRAPAKRVPVRPVPTKLVPAK